MQEGETREQIERPSIVRSVSEAKPLNRETSKNRTNSPNDFNGKSSTSGLLQYERKEKKKIYCNVCCQNIYIYISI